MTIPNRETKEFKTTGGNVIVYKSYITGRESNEIQKILLKDMKIEVGEAKLSPFVGAVSAANITELNNKTIELLVTLLNGTAENILDRILDLPNTEYAEISAKLNEISGDKKKE